MNPLRVQFANGSNRSMARLKRVSSSDAPDVSAALPTAERVARIALEGIPREGNYARHTCQKRLARSRATLDETFLQAWQELGERLGSRSLSLQTTNIVQQIAAPAMSMCCAWK
jgi:hypothetical protein